MATILLIEDDGELREQLRDGLEAAGHTVTEAANGLDGLAEFHTSYPNIVITDIVMEEKEGMEVLLTVRKTAPHLPVITISGRAEYLEISQGLGATKTLLKPFRMPALLDSIENAIRL